MPIRRSANRTLVNFLSALNNQMLEDFQVLAIPTKTNFRGINLREVVIFHGPFGYSEFSPFVEYSKNESKNWMRAAIEAAYKPKPELRKSKVKINATLPKVDLDKVKNILDLYPGAKTIKIKVDSFVEDAKLVSKALEYAPSAQIRLDVNGGWDLQRARENIEKFDHEFGSHIEYYEQPCADLSELKKLKEITKSKIAADESIRKNLDFKFEELSEYVDIAILKWQPVGGFNAACELAEKIKLPVVISSALETGIGVGLGLHLAASIGTELACGLGTVGLLEADIVNEPLEIIDGEIAVISRTPNQEQIAKYRASEERWFWWKKRVEEVLGSGDFDEYFN